jgi:hypothetical protein
MYLLLYSSGGNGPRKSIATLSNGSDTAVVVKISFSFG